MHSHSPNMATPPKGNPVVALFGRLSIAIKTALWQAPLVLVLASEIGWFLAAFWAASLGVSMITERWQHWFVQLGLLSVMIAAALALVPVRSADFFILILVFLLPMTWRLDSVTDPRPLSPAGLTPTIFLVGAVFIYQIQFIVLLLLVIWLLSFLLWYCMALTGFRLDRISLRWVPVLSVSVLVAGVIVVLFTLVPRIDTGFIPGFADPKQKIALTDAVSPGGMSDLLADTDLAFKAVPGNVSDTAPQYWRVFVLPREKGGNWQRNRVPSRDKASTIPSHATTHRYALLAEGHDMTTLPVPGWPAGWDSSIRYSLWGEANSMRANTRQGEVKGAVSAPNFATDPLSRRELVTLSDANPELVAWAKAERPRFANDADFVESVMARFADDFVYDTSIALPDENALDAFFFASKRGYCSYFATSLATILRAAGIEANVVLGYMGGEWNEFGNFWSVRNADAHAWVEARLDGGGWQRFDPTLLVMTATTAPTVTLEQGELVARPQANDTNQSRSVLAQLARAGEWMEALNTRITLAIMDYGQDDTAASGPQRDFTALIILALSLGLAGVFVFSVVRFWQRRRGLEHRIEARFEKALAPVLGPDQRRDGETILALADRAAADLPEPMAYDIRFVARMVTDWRYAPVAALDVSEIKSIVRNLARDTRRHIA